MGGFQKIQSPRLFGVGRKFWYWGVGNHVKFTGKIVGGRGNARNGAQIKNDFFVTTMLQIPIHPPPGAKSYNMKYYWLVK